MLARWPALLAVLLLAPRPAGLAQEAEGVTGSRLDKPILEEPVQEEGPAAEETAPVARAVPAGEAAAAAEPPVMRAAPQPDPAGAGPAPQPEPEGTVITASREATFDGPENLATFLGEVVVLDPQFKMTSDRLTVYLHDDSAQTNGPEKSEPAAAEKADPAAGAGRQQPPQNGNESRRTGAMKSAVAEGNVVVTQERGSGNRKILNVGKAERAVYDAGTGEFRLMGSPQVQQGINLHIGTAPDSVMIMTRDGKMRTEGPNRTIIQEPSASTTP